MAWAMRHRSVSSPRSSNRTCGFPASGSPTGFTSRPTAWSKVHADEVQHAKLPEHDLGREAPRSAPLHLATMDEEVAHAVVDMVVDRPVGLQPGDLLARRSELVALDVEDLTFAEDGTGTALIRRSKTDQVGEGAIGFIAHDTVEHIQRWLEAVGVSEGPLFRSARTGKRFNDRDVPRIFKKMARAAGLELDPSGHSTRVGVAQDMTAAGFGTAEVMQAGRWKTPAMVARYSEQQQARRGASAKLAALQNR